ncbi:MAG TPA: hypothetical protein VI688_02760 [Anaerolineales bacterium]|nr:hypothetical protein [Anaerolineales bacterium]
MITERLLRVASPPEMGEVSDGGVAWFAQAVTRKDVRKNITNSLFIWFSFKGFELQVTQNEFSPKI